MRTASGFVMVFGTAGACLAQSATVAMSHNDPDGLVNPGQTIQITTTVIWNGGTNFYEVRGGVRATGDAGTASNNVFPLSSASTPLRILNPGTTVGGSVLDVQIRGGDLSPIAGFLPMMPWLISPLSVLRYDWTAPIQPGIVEFNWERAISLPDVWIVSPLLNPFVPIAVPTTVLGTSLIVVPGPGPIAALTLASALLAARRRRL